MVLVGYDGESPSYRIYRPATRQVIKTRNVRFIEAPTGIINLQPDAREGVDTPENPQAGDKDEEDYGTGFSELWSPEEETTNDRNTEQDADTTTTGQHPRVTPAITRSKSVQGSSIIRHHLGQDRQQPRELHNIAPYLQDASDSDHDDDQDPEAEEIAGWDLNTGSAVTATKAEPAPPYSIPIPRNYEEAMYSRTLKNGRKQWNAS